MCSSEKQCLDQIRDLLTYLPQNNLEDPPVIEPKHDSSLVSKVTGFFKGGKKGPSHDFSKLDTIIPADDTMPYDMLEILTAVLDDGRIMQVHEHFAPSLIVGFGRIDGRTVGIVANQPAHLAGVLDTETSAKGARFIRFCDCFNIPLVVFEDAPGFLPGVSQEHSGVIKEGAKMLYAFCEATVPRITVVIRKAYGGAYIAMNSKHIGCDLNFAWPSAQIAVMGAEGAVKILFRKRLKDADDPEEERKKLVADYNEKFGNPYVAANKGYIDEVIMPHETRDRLVTALRSLEDKREGTPARKHGNLPL
jgi:acetyl-CoA carboxylase carboxyltransferase component